MDQIETHIIMHNFKMQNWNQQIVWKKAFLCIGRPIFTDSCHKKMLLESLNIPLIVLFHFVWFLVVIDIAKSPV